MRLLLSEEEFDNFEDIIDDDEEAQIIPKKRNSNPETGASLENCFSRFLMKTVE